MHLFVPFLTLLPGCAATDDTGSESGQTDSGNPSGETGQPNDADDPAHANALVLDEEAEGSIHDDDVDWFKIAGLAGQQFRVQVVNDDEGAYEGALDTVVEVFDSALTRIAWEDNHPVGDVGTYDTVAFGFFPADGDYYVTVQDKQTFEGASGDVKSTDYTLTVLSPSQLPTEPDSVFSVGLSYRVETDNSWYAIPVLAESVGDTDHVKLALSHNNGALAFAAAQHIESSGYVPAITLYNADAETVLFANTIAPSDGRQFISPPGTEYILAVADSSLGSGPAQGMWVFVANAEAGYGNVRETEPNDEAAEVISLANQSPDAGFWLAAFMEGRVAAAADVDRFEFTTTNEGYLTIGFGARVYGSLLSANVRIWQDDVEVASGTTEGGTDPAVQTSGKVPAGRYSVEVSAVDGSPFGEGAYYRLAVHSTSIAL